MKLQIVVLRLLTFLIIIPAPNMEMHCLHLHGFASRFTPKGVFYVSSLAFPIKHKSLSLLSGQVFLNKQISRRSLYFKRFQLRAPEKLAQDKISTLLHANCARARASERCCQSLRLGRCFNFNPFKLAPSDFRGAFLVGIYKHTRRGVRRFPSCCVERFSNTFSTYSETQKLNWSFANIARGRLGQLVETGLQ